jgi:hypothetical protein
MPRENQDIGHMNPGDEAPPETPGAGEDLCRVCNGTVRLKAGNATSAAAPGRSSKVLAADRS